MSYPMSLRNWLFASSPLLLCVVALTACAPKQLSEGAPWVTARHGVHDAHLQTVDGYPSLRLNASLAAQLKQAAQGNDPVQMKRESQAILDRAHELAIASIDHELDQLDKDGWDELAHRYFADQPRVNRTQMRQSIHASLRSQYDHLHRNLEIAPDAKALHDALADIEQHINQAIKNQGRIARALPWALATIPSALVVADIHQDEWRGSNDADFAATRRYVPQINDAADTSGWPQTDEHDLGLLQRYAPVIYQEINRDAPYPPSLDKFGTVVAEDHEHIAIDTDRPAVYAYARQVSVQGQWVSQLIYTHWYPEHPKLKSFDPEAGHLEGVTFRVTLDANDEPLLYESVYNCGCYHRIYMPEHVEQAAMDVFGEPEEGKHFAVEHSVPHRIDMIVPELVQDGFGADGMGKPIIRCRAGWHAIVDVALDEDDRSHEVQDQAAYTLLPYAQLEDLPTTEGGYTSMFYDNGLVRGAQRLEGIFFTPLGILSAGQPRQRGTQLIHWDQWDFDDPYLFDKALRLPPLERHDIANQPPRNAAPVSDQQANGPGQSAPQF